MQYSTVSCSAAFLVKAFIAPRPSWNNTSQNNKVFLILCNACRTSDQAQRNQHTSLDTNAWNLTSSLRDHINYRIIWIRLFVTRAAYLAGCVCYFYLGFNTSKVNKNRCWTRECNLHELPKDGSIQVIRYAHHSCEAPSQVCQVFPAHFFGLPIRPIISPKVYLTGWRRLETM